MPLPLEGVRILDLTNVMAGPYCSMVLGDMGAEVIKLESLDGDSTRNFEPRVNDESYCFAVLNRNKKSISVDLKAPRGKDIVMKLAAGCDVMMENFRPGVVKKLGIAYDDVKQVNPGIIYASMSGFGQTGPYGRKGGFDIIAQGMSGIMMMTGEPGGRPAKVGIAMNDIACGVTTLYGILGAFIGKLRHGQGQYIETSLLEGGPGLEHLGIRRLVRRRRAADGHRHAASPLRTVPGLPLAGRLRHGRRERRQAVACLRHAGGGTAAMAGGPALPAQSVAGEERRRAAGPDRGDLHHAADRALGREA